MDRYTAGTPLLCLDELQFNLSASDVQAKAQPAGGWLCLDHAGANGPDGAIDAMDMDASLSCWTGPMSESAGWSEKVEEELGGAGRKPVLKALA